MKLKKFNFKIVNSTNDLAIKIIKNTNNKLGIVIAEKQKKGRGQYGKKWTSFKGNLFISILKLLMICLDCQKTIQFYPCPYSLYFFH